MTLAHLFFISRLLFSNLVLLATLALAVIAWIIAFVAQIASEADNQRQGVQWFNVFLHLFLILGIAVVIMTDSVAMARIQICAFLAIGVVFSVFGIDQGIYSNQGARNAVTAGYFILTIVDIIWLLYFTSEEDSFIYGILNGFGNGMLGGPGGRGSRGTGGMSSRMGGGSNTNNNSGGYVGGYPNQGVGTGGYQSTYGQGPSAADVTIDAQKSNGPGSIRSGNTNHAVGGMTAAPALVKSDYSSHHGSEIGRAASPASTNKQSVPGTIDGAIAAGEPTAGYGYRARALYACEYDPASFLH